MLADQRTGKNSGPAPADYRNWASASPLLNYHHLFVKRLFKFPRHLILALEINRIIAMSDICIHSAIFKLTRTQKGTQNRTWKRKQTWKWSWKRTWKRKWTWKRKRKLYLVWRNSPYSAVRIVANMSMAQFPMALCTCSGFLLGKDWHKNCNRYWNYSLNDVLAELEGRYQRYVQYCKWKLTWYIPNLVWGVAEI